MRRAKVATLKTTELAALEGENGRLKARLRTIAAVAGAVASDAPSERTAWMAAVNSLAAMAEDALEAA